MKIINKIFNKILGVHVLTETPDKNNSYITTKNGKQIANLEGTEFDIGKTVYANFNKEGYELDPFDTSWDVIHIDGNSLNNHIDNLKYIKI